MKDMTAGNPARLIVSFAMPMLFGNMFQQVYNLADTIIVGRFVGKNALAAVGSAFTVMVFITSIITGLCMGASIVISQFFGGKQHGRLRAAISSSFLFILGITAVMTVATLIFTDQFLSLMKIPEELLGDSRVYLKIIFAGLTFTFLYNGAAYLLRSLGDSKRPLYFLVIAALTNIVLDLWFVAGLGMGVAGAAIATVISQAVSAVLCTVYCFKKLSLPHSDRGLFVFDKEIFAMTAKYSVLTSAQQSIMNFGILMIQGLVNTFGANAIAAFAVGAKLDAFAFMPVQDFGNAFSTYIAQNMGAGKVDRIKQGLHSVAKIIAAFCTLISAAVLLMARHFILLFVKPGETEVINLGIRYISVVGIFYILIGFLFMFYGFFRGTGYLRMSIILTIVSLGTRVVLAYSFSAVPGIGLAAVYWAIPIGWALADIVGVVQYKKGNWQPFFQ